MPRASGLCAPRRSRRDERATVLAPSKAIRFHPFARRALKDFLGQREARLIGRSLELATGPPLRRFRLRRRWPAGDRCLGLRGRRRRQPAGGPSRRPARVRMHRRPAAILASAPAVLPARIGWTPWLSALLCRDFCFLLLLLMTSWLAACCSPVRSDAERRHLERRRRRPRPKRRPIRRQSSKASLDDAQADENKLKASSPRWRPLRTRVAMQADRAPSRHAPPRRYKRQTPPLPLPAPATGRGAAAPPAPPVNRPHRPIARNWSGDSGGEGVTATDTIWVTSPDVVRHQLQPVC